MYFKDLLEYAKGVIKDHPQLKQDVYELVELAQTEIEDGGSEIHECELAVGSIKELIEESHKPRG